MDDFLTTFYTIVGGWYQQHAPRLLAGRTGKQPPSSDTK